MSNDIAETKKIANVRIHIERVIQRLKTFKILSHVLPISSLNKGDDIITVCCAIINLHGPIVKHWNQTGRQ